MLPAENSLKPVVGRGNCRMAVRVNFFMMCALCVVFQVDTVVTISGYKIAACPTHKTVTQLGKWLEVAPRLAFRAF